MANHTRRPAAAVLLTIILALAACSRQPAEVPKAAPAPAPAAAAPAAPPSTPVTGENFVRAESDRMFTDFLKLTGGVNKTFHFRRPTPLDQQTVVRMNRDTIYTGAIIDTSEGGTITLPPSPDKRYVSIHLIDNDHYDLGVLREPGVHELPKGVGHIVMIARVQVFNPNDASDLAAANAWQDKLAIDAKGARPFVPGNWERASLDKLRDELEVPCRRFPNFEQAMMPRGKADPEQRLCAAGNGWGLLPGEEATYFSYAGGHPANECRRATYTVPKNRAFWSITVYNERGFIAYENSTINSSNVKLAPDGKSFTVYFGAEAVCGNVPNRLDTPNGWNYMMRVYRPDASVLNGGYVLPKKEVVKRTS